MRQFTLRGWGFRVVSIRRALLLEGRAVLMLVDTRCHREELLSGLRGCRIRHPKNGVLEVTVVKGCPLIKRSRT